MRLLNRVNRHDLWGCEALQVPSARPDANISALRPKRANPAWCLQGPSGNINLSLFPTMFFHWIGKE